MINHKIILEFPVNTKKGGFISPSATGREPAPAPGQDPKSPPPFQERQDPKIHEASIERFKTFALEINNLFSAYSIGNSNAERYA